MDSIPNTDRAAADRGAALGAIAGLVAGTAYLCAQITFAATVHEGSWTLPLQRISAILLGDDAVSSPGEMSHAIFGMALLVHVVLCVFYGRLVGLAVRGRGLAQAALVGAAVGVALFVLNFWLIAPEVFPWFTESRTFTTAADHVLFGVVAALVYSYLSAFAGTHLGRRKQIT